MSVSTSSSPKHGSCRKEVSFGAYDESSSRSDICPASTSSHADRTDSLYVTFGSKEKSSLSVNGAKGVSDCHRVLREVFGHQDFKGKQKEIIDAAISNFDVFVLAPTGMGKSICFQVPAVAAEHGITIVVSPLLALMKNQVSQMRRKRISVVAFTSETPPEEKAEIIDDLSSGYPTIRLLYITPEKLVTREFLSLLQEVYDNNKLNRLVIDEAHCISEWGHDFRPEYHRLGSFRSKFPEVPIMALTATATPSVQDDIVRNLGMSEDRLFKAAHPFNRANLFYEVRYRGAPNSSAQMADIADYIHTLHRRRQRPSSGIIYCRAKKTCDDLAMYLRGKGLNAKAYHRGLPSATLGQTLKDWEIGGTGDGGVDVVCATIAFGMGIDKSDVRYIIHYDLPKSVEGYYQETGRAGRDGAPAKCVLYYSREDALTVRRLVNASLNSRPQTLEGPAPSQRSIDSLSALIKCAETVDTCRHISICRYFGENIDDNDEYVRKQYCDKMCDICKYPEKTKRRRTELSSQLDPLTNTHNIPRSHSHDALEGDREQGRLEWQGSRDANRNSSRELENTPPISRFADESVMPKRNLRDLMDKRASKKPKISLPPLLVTKPFQSASSLNKPFKTPFKTPFRTQPSSGVVPKPPEEPIVIDDSMEIDDSVMIVEADPKPMLPAPSHSNDDEVISIPSSPHNQESADRSSPPIDLPDIAVDLDAAYSEKINVAAREEAFVRIGSKLHKVFMAERDQEKLWRYISPVPKPDLRDTILHNVTRELEFSVHSMSATQGGYNERVVMMVELLQHLKSPEAWRDGVADDFEDVHDVVGIIRNTSAKIRKGARGSRL